jgi:hypothetical protein
MRRMGYASCKADPDLWLKAVTRPEDNVHYYAYILCYVDGVVHANVGQKLLNCYPFRVFSGDR